MADETPLHQPVLLYEVLEALAIVPDGIYMDLTYGRGGHAAAILERLGANGRLVVMDQDPEAIASAQQRFGDDARVSVRRGSFAGVGEIAAQLGITGMVKGVLMDLGVSSTQLDDPQRGFSFMREGPLDMRMDPDSGVSAAEWLARAREEDIVKVLREYGEERFARRIARTIVAQRDETPIRTTRQLRSLIVQAVPAREKHKDPATRSFQAIRIFLNRELEVLQDCLDRLIEVLAPGGRFAVISFHSLEDRIVKRFIRRQVRGEEFPRGLPVRETEQRPRLRMIGKAIRPGVDEIDRNPRARSAVLRIAEKPA